MLGHCFQLISHCLSDEPIRAFQLPLSTAPSRHNLMFDSCFKTNVSRLHSASQSSCMTVAATCFRYTSTFGDIFFFLFRPHTSARSPSSGSCFSPVCAPRVHQKILPESTVALPRVAELTLGKQSVIRWMGFVAVMDMLLIRFVILGGLGRFRWAASKLQSGENGWIRWPLRLCACT